MFLFVRFLLQRGASLTAVNCDGDVPVDIALDETTESIIQNYTRRQGECVCECVRGWLSCSCVMHACR